jgi:heme-degrading monooxygenase HmoA
MFARMTTFRPKPGAIDDLIRAFQDSLAPVSAEQPGFGGITLLIDPQTGAALSLALWATEADRQTNERSNIHQEWLASIAQLLAGPPAHTDYEVCVQVELTEQGTAHVRGI